MPSPTLITKRQAAEILGITPSGVQRMMERGRLAPAKTIEDDGRVVLHLFSQAAVERLARKAAA